MREMLAAMLGIWRQQHLPEIVANLANRKQLLALLDADVIPITLSEEDQLELVQSTSAIVLHHPQTKDFSV